MKNVPEKTFPLRRRDKFVECDSLLVRKIPGRSGGVGAAAVRVRPWCSRALTFLPRRRPGPHEHYERFARESDLLIAIWMNTFTSRPPQQIFLPGMQLVVVVGFSPISDI